MTTIGYRFKFKRDNDKGDRLRFDLAYKESISLLRSLLAYPIGKVPLGFYASNVEVDNYKRLFTRDAVWIGLAALLSGEDDLIAGFKASLDTLILKQREDGAVPSNVSPEGEVSYGIINPRVDPTTLFIIACAQYYIYSKDQKAFESFYPAVEKAVSYLEDTWEDDRSGLLYIPRAGNWADEYLQEGFVLYDEVLWFMALKKYGYMLETVGDKRAKLYYEKAGRVKNTIREYYWIRNSFTKKDKIYESMRKKIDLDKMGYLMHFYYVRGKNTWADDNLPESNSIFDAFGNTLAILTGVATKKQTAKINAFIAEVSRARYPLVPAHYPFFKEETFRSKKLHQYRFKEYIGHYHNGGLWPWYTGLYAASLVKIGDANTARKFAEGILAANAAKKNGTSYYEYHVAKKSIVHMRVDHENGLDMNFSRVLARYVSRKMPNVQIKKGSEKCEIVSPLSVRNFNFVKGDKIKITAVGPYSDDVLAEIAAFKDRSGNRYFSNIKMISVKGSPDGTPQMGISAAAFIFAYKALLEGKVIFFDTIEKEVRK